MLSIVLLAGCSNIEIVNTPEYYHFGPFTGKVVDIDTGKPIEGALVYFQMSTYQLVLGSAKNSDSAEEYVFTDKDGKYKIDQIKMKRFLNKLEAKDTPFTFAIYKKGYVCYNSKIIFPCRDKRTDFKWKNNIAKLEPWRDYYTYRDHSWFIPRVFTDSMRPELETSVGLWELDIADNEIGKYLDSGKDPKFQYKDVSCRNKKEHETKFEEKVENK